VRKQLLEIQTTGADYVLILAGDHLYRMDYTPMAEFHWENDADITVAVQPVPVDQAYRFGILKRSAGGRITDFAEKPKDPALLEQLVSRDDPHKPYLGSMGLYMFKTKVLVDLLANTTDDDFGGEVIPKAIQTHHVFGFDFTGYWEDIGTIRSFYETNLSLTLPDSPFSFHDPQRPIYTRPRFLPGSVIDGAALHNVLLSEGCRIYRADIRHSIVGLRSYISSGVRMTDTIMMGTDYYDPPDAPPDCCLPLGIGPDCQIEGAILDKNVRIGAGVIIRPFPLGTELDNKDWVVRDGIVVIPKNTVLPAGTVIAPG
jgi:glucose-1-phosphate adenylyltransferase